MRLVPDFTDYPSASPGLCYFCRCIRREGEPGVIQTDTAIDMEGLVEICVACVTEMGALFGMLTAERSEKLVKANREYGRQAKAALKRVERDDVIGKLVRELKAEKADNAEAAFTPSAL